MEYENWQQDGFTSESFDLSEDQRSTRRTYFETNNPYYLSTGTKDGQPVTWTTFESYDLDVDMVPRLKYRVFPLDTPADIRDIDVNLIDDFYLRCDIQTRIGFVAARFIHVDTEDDIFYSLNDVLPLRKTRETLEYNRKALQWVEDSKSAAAVHAFGRLAVDKTPLSSACMRFSDFFIGSVKANPPLAVKDRDILNAIYRTRFVESVGLPADRRILEDQEKELYLDKPLTVDGTTISIEDLKKYISGDENEQHPPHWYTKNLIPDATEELLARPIMNEEIFHQQMLDFFD